MKINLFGFNNYLQEQDMVSFAGKKLHNHVNNKLSDLTCLPTCSKLEITMALQIIVHNMYFKLHAKMYKQSTFCRNINGLFIILQQFLIQLTTSITKNKIIFPYFIYS